MIDLSLVLLVELLSLSRTLFPIHHATPSLHHTHRNTSGYSFPSAPTSCWYVCCINHQTVMNPFTSRLLKTWTNFFPLIQTPSSSYGVTSIVITPVCWVWVPLSPIMALQQRISVTLWDLHNLSISRPRYQSMVYHLFWIWKWIFINDLWFSGKSSFCFCW